MSEANVSTGAAAPATATSATSAPAAAKAPAQKPKTVTRKAAPKTADPAATKKTVATMPKEHASGKPSAIPPTKPKETSFENHNATNPIASQEPVRKTLEQKIRELAEKSEAKKAASGKKTAVVNPDDGRTGDQIRDASAVASPKSARAQKETTEATEDPAPVEQEQNLEAVDAEPSEFEQLEGTVAIEDPVADPVVEEAPWEPDYKFRSRKFDEQGNAVEFETEIPEKFRGLVTDKESEAELKKIFSAVNGIEYVQTRRDQYKAQVQKAEEYIGKVQERLRGVDDMIASGDLDSAFQTMQLPEEKVLQWVLDKINYSQLDPAQRQLIDAQRASDKRAKSLEQANKAMFQDNLNAIAQNKAIALDAILERPDLKTVIAAYDNRPGKKPTDPSFRDLCINHGELTWHRSRGKADPSPIECVEAVLQDMGIEQGYRQVSTANAPAATRTPNPAPVARQTQARTAQSLPNVASRAASPTQPRITNMKQLMERRKQILGS